jgi:preprotein translocase subunit SecG
MTALSILIIISSILLILIVLVQNSKGGGLDSNLASQSSAFGAQKTTELVEKLTWGLAAALIIFSIASTKLISKDNIESSDNTVTNSDSVPDSDSDTKTK